MKKGVLVLCIVALLMSGCMMTSEDPSVESVVGEMPTADSTAEPSLPPDQHNDPSVRPSGIQVQSAQGFPVVQGSTSPREISIPRLHATLPIDPVGVAKDGQMEIPPDAARAGWYKYGSTVGASAGTTVIAAHAGSYITRKGPMRNLSELRPGDLIDVMTDEDEIISYEVRSVDVFDKSVIKLQDYFRRDGEHELVLITCDGQWDRNAQSYTANAVVTATVVRSDKDSD